MRVYRPVLVLLFASLAMLGLAIEAQSPTIIISSPGNEATVNIESGLVVSGIGRNLPEGNVVVRVTTSAGVILDEQPTTADFQSGNWSVVLGTGQLNTQATILAYAPSPSDGTTLASASVTVQLTFNPPVQPTAAPLPTATAVPAFVSIFTPVAGDTVNVDQGLAVNGTSTGAPENNIVIRVTDGSGSIVAETPTTANFQTGNWSQVVDVGGHTGLVTLFVFIPSPADGTAIATDSVRVTLTASPAPTETPTPPQPPQGPSSLPVLLAIIAGVVLAIAGGAAAGYAYWRYRQGEPPAPARQDTHRPPGT
jgi:hypothetical protein